ncbi:hypothetical protein C8F04DRAFT_1264801 [Mycena alexandri]|uniref:Uncharacterized protein n=1 Tax=Mycena alexandri TaxID=1745969 RepID=A0AAD6SL82_9AGAR|nr:hypothetical protein C8F04DRAFT_1264801 [Mycena alexandri]
MAKRKAIQLEEPVDDPSERIRLLEKQLQEKEHIIAKLRKTKAKAKLIPKPEGQAGRSEEGGGYNLQVAMGLEDDNTRYLRINRIVKRYVHDKLAVCKTLSDQERGQVARLVVMIQNDFPYFKKFESGWPIRDIIRVYLQNEHARARRDREAELACADNSDSALPKTSSNKTAVQVSFAVSEDEEDVPAKKKLRTFPKKKLHPVILSEAEDSADDLQELIRGSGRSKGSKTTSKPADNKENQSAEAEKSKKRKAEVEAGDVVVKKASTSDPNLPLLALFNKLQNLEYKDGLNAKGTSLIRLEICIHITREKRRGALSRLGKTRRWPTVFDYGDIADRVFALKPKISTLITDSYVLDSSPFWEEFLLAIDYKLADFCASRTKVGFLAARGLQSCGYFGPQGKFVIVSCLLRMLEELKLHNDDLEQTLFVTLHTVITHGKSCKQLDYDDDDLATSNYLTLEDFTDYILLPFVSSSLISEDLPGFETLLDAFYEKQHSHEYGEFFSPENDDDDEAHNVHRDNVRAIRGLQSMQESPPSPPPSSAPPRYRKGVVKKESSFKIRIPPGVPPPEEKEITLADFPSPTSKKAAAPPRPKPKPKTKKKDSSHEDKKAIVPSRYSTRSQAKLS